MARDMKSHAGLTQPRTLFQQQLERLCSKNCVDAVKEAFGENFMSKQVSVGACAGNTDGCKPAMTLYQIRQ